MTQITGYALFMSGFAVILATKMFYNVSLIPDSVHAWAGMLTVAMATLQVKASPAGSENDYWSAAARTGPGERMTKYRSSLKRGGEL
jgi:hypothetical protein